MPIVTIEWYEGRSPEQKKEIAEKLTDLLVDVGKTHKEHVWIRYVDSPRADWAMGGEIQGS
jgi:4-oxalocrotonate tautomerase